MDLCPRVLKEHLELNHSEEEYAKVRSEILQYTQRHSGDSAQQLVAMECDWVGYKHNEGYWDDWTCN
eukprot:498789-Lingulodinium_polyedra.AAC.1